MTRTRTYLLTAIAAGLFVVLSWVFADDQFTGTFWDTNALTESTIWTYVMLLIIIAVGLYQAQQLPDTVPVDSPADRADLTPGQVEDPLLWRRLMGNVYYALLWLPIRFFVGREWLAAGEHKVRDDAWMDGGEALRGYWERVTTVPEGRPTSPAGTYGWFEDFLRYMLRNEWYDWFAKVIAIGEVLVGLGLIVGALVGVAAFFGTLMNFNFQLAGSASTNPVLFGLGVFLVLAWKVAGWWGLDRWLLPLLGTPWHRGRVFARETVVSAPPAA